MIKEYLQSESLSINELVQLKEYCLRKSLPIEFTNIIWEMNKPEIIENGIKFNELKKEALKLAQTLDYA
jgi:hypothetical protein